ncbi:MAG: sugar-binding domain-containing protein [Pirellulaceae bacterium]
MRRILNLAAVGLLLAIPSISLAQWQPAKGPLMTRWAKDVSPDNVHPEYPRPQMVRKEWTNLNGLWDYALVAQPQSKDDWSEPQAWAGKILVPFPIESALSGVMKRVAPGQRLWYRRTFKTPKLAEGGRLLLHFGAVDWQATVFVNDGVVGEHTGGYDPFSFDITDALDPAKGEQTVLVAVSDPTDANWQPRGKQVNAPKGIWYTPTTGIWQTVWLETVPQVYIKSVEVRSELDRDGEVQFILDLSGREPRTQTLVEVFAGDNPAPVVSQTVSEDGFQLQIPNPRRWTPDDPFLYGVRLKLASGDTIDSYFALRDIKLGKDEAGVTRMLLNGEPLFQYGPLDQGFWPDGLYTAPTDEALRYDLEMTKKLGFNMVRKHVKVEPARWYHHCDKMGLLVWQDMPNGDKHAPWNPTGGHDGEEIERSAESAANFRTEWKAIIDDLRHFPSIVVWVPFNEAWGQFDTVAVTKWTQEYDPSRLVNCASGGNDFPVGDIYDLHRYPGPTIPKLEENRAAVLGEYGGLGLPVEGHTWQAKDNWGYRSFKTKDELAAAYTQLIYKLRPLIGKGLSAAIYTQTTDVEVEVNGLLTYDRAVLKVDLEKTAALHKKLYQPLPKETIVVPTSLEEPQTWRYTTTKPAEGWAKADFDDTSWQTGPGGFGNLNPPGSKVRSDWKTPDIWLRRTVKLPAGEGGKESATTGRGYTSGYALSIHHDEDAEIYLNGALIASVKGYTTEYNAVPLDEKAFAAAARPGENVLAVHCHQTGGGQYIDVGLVRLEEK